MKTMRRISSYLPRRAALGAAGLAALLALGCAPGDGTTGIPEGPHPLPNYEDGKADNYVSTNAREFDLRGTAHVTLPEGFDTLDAEAKAAKLDALVQSRLSQVAWAVRSHVERVVRDASGGTSGENARFFTYFKRDHSDAEPAVVLPAEARARFTFHLELVGSYHLMSQLAPGRATRRAFELALDGEPAPVRVVITGSDSRDAFPKYDELFADGVYDIAVHFGGDYNEGRFDLETAKWMVTALLEGGWTHEKVTGFADLAIDSGPFVRSLVVEGKPIEARVYVYHADMVTPDQEHLLSEAMKASLAERDVVVYSGHAGPGAGFILDYQPRHEIPARDFATLPLAEKYQIYVFDGCQTYRTYVDDLMQNPNKTFANVDVVTTVNTTPFAVGYQMIHQLLYWLTLTDGAGNHFPLSWQTLLRGLNTEKYKSVHYGVHGIDDDPRLNPHASEGITCRPCSTDADCGAGGNFCLGYAGGSACGVACTTDEACGAGYRCGRITDDPDLFYLPKQCVRRDYRCR